MVSVNILYVVGVKRLLMLPQCNSNSSSSSMFVVLKAVVVAVMMVLVKVDLLR